MGWRMDAGARLVGALALLAGIAAGAPARAEARDPICLVPQAFPVCRVSLVLDWGIRGRPAGAAPREGTSPYSQTLEPGFLINFAPRSSLGLSGGWIFDADYPAGVVRGRYRFWPFRLLALEGSGGVLIKRGDAPGVPGAGSIAEAAVTFADVVGVTATVEHYPGAETLGIVGVRFGFGLLAGPAYLCGPGCHDLRF